MIVRQINWSAVEKSRLPQPQVMMFPFGKSRVTLRVRSFFPEIFLKKMKVYRVKKRNDRQMAPLGRGAASACFRLLPVACGEMSSDRPFKSKTLPKLVQSSFKEQALSLQELNSASRSKHPPDSSSIWLAAVDNRLASLLWFPGFGRQQVLEKSNTKVIVSSREKE